MDPIAALGRMGPPDQTQLNEMQLNAWDDHLLRRVQRTFVTAETPQQQPFGEYAGRWLATTLPSTTDAVVSAVLRGAGVWRGKRFLDGRGANIVAARAVPLLRAITDQVQTRGAHAEAAPFEIRRGPTIHGVGDAWLLDYDVAVNRWPLRQLRDEVRATRDGRLIGRATLELVGRRGVLGYFLLRSADRSRVARPAHPG